MDGKIFFRSVVTPPPGTYFAFDLQRFATFTITSEEVTEGEETKTKYFYEDTETATGYDTEDAAAIAGGAKFTSTQSGTKTYYTEDNEFNSTNLNGATNIEILGDITLQDNVDVDLNSSAVDLSKDDPNTIKVSGTATLDLADKTLTINRSGTVSKVVWTNPAASAIVVQDGANFTVKGTTGTINYTWQPATDLSTIKDARHCAAIQIGNKVGKYGDDLSNTANAIFNMESGTIQSYSTAISMSDNANFNVNGGTIRSTNSCGVYYGNDSPGGGTMNIKGGTIETGKASQLPAIQVAGDVGDVNATNKTYEANLATPAIIKVSGGTIAHKGTNGLSADGTSIVGNPNAICASGNVDLDISGGTITSTGSAVEIRAGSLNITGGNISSTAEKYLSVKKSGGSSYGVGVSIAQHSTIQNIKVNISGNTNITALNALGAANPQANKNMASGVVTATIDGGNFTSTKKSSTDATSGNAILTDKTNITLTVNGGNLNGNVTVTKNTATTSTDQKTDEAAVVLAGGTTTGTVKVVETDNTGTVKEELTGETGKAALKVMGGKITDKASAENYVADGSKIDANGNVTEDPDNGWSLTSANTYQYLLGGKTALLIANNVSDSVDNLKYDADNKLFGVTGEYSWATTSPNGDSVSADERKPYSLAKYTVASGAVTVQPEKPAAGYEYVKINGTGFIDNTIVTLEAAGEVASLGVYVDATDNRLANITGGVGKDYIKAGDRRTTLNGGANDDTLDGGDDADTFVFTAGNDVINNYEYGTDTVNVDDSLTPPISFADSLVSFDGSNFVFNFGNNNTLRFNNTAEVALHKGTNVYTYQGNTSGGINYMAHEGNGISLGTGFSDRFNGTTAANEEYATINAGRVNSAIRITGNDLDNYIVASSIGGGTLEGGAGDDVLNGAGATASLRFEGGAGADSMVGGEGYNLFIYTEGADSISGYHGKDLVTVRGSAANLEKATFSLTGNDSQDIKLSFESDDDNLTFEGGATLTNAISIQSGNNVYAYKKDRVARDDEAITLTSGLADTDSTFAAGTYNTVNAVDVGHAISIIGNDNANVIFGSKKGGTLGGGAGKDKLILPEERTNDASFVFQYTAGKDTVEGFDAKKDKLDMTAAQLEKITKGKSNKNDTKLEFTFGKSDVLTFKSEDEIGRVSLNGDTGFLTEDGIVSINGGKGKLDLFASARSKIDLTDPIYSISSGIASVDASDVKKQNVTIVGGSNGGTFTFAGKNKKKDQFEYNGGNVTISGYEAGVDKLDLNTAELGKFTVDPNGGNVSLSAGTGTNTVVLESLQGQEVMLHHAGSTSNSPTKMVFEKDGVILNKSKRPTMATVSAYYDATSTVKKIFVTSDIEAGASIVAGAKAKTTIDASAATSSVSLIGGDKNDKLIGSTVASVVDHFVYTAGKDIIENYGSSDQISLGGGFTADSLFSAKISTGKRSIKFKFSNKNALTIKPAKGSNMGDTLNFSDVPNYTYSKNAIASGTKATLTSEFSGSYKTKDKAVSVDGSRVEKNLTYKGTSDAETLSGGTKKTTFKGGGGNDSLKGGSGKDVFFYAKNDKGNTTIANFDFSNDKVKIASGTITDISTVSGGIKFDMNSGRKGSANIGSFTVANSLGGGDIDTTKTLIKASNTYFWFAQEDVTDKDNNTLAKAGDLITADTKVSKSNATSTGYAILDLGYSTNLVKAGVATKAGEFTFTSSGIIKKPTT